MLKIILAINLFMTALNIQATEVFEKTFDAKEPIIVHQGGMRSSKTWSITQYWIIKLLNERGKILTVVREDLTSCYDTVMKDFFEVLNEYGLYNSNNHRKTRFEYELNGNLIQFRGCKEPQKIRGAKRDYLWFNEANEISYEAYYQLYLRSVCEKLILDYNPSDSEHWIYDLILSRPDCKTIFSTYKDNPFLPKTQVKEIELMCKHDPWFKMVYGEGKVGRSPATIYNNWKHLPFEKFPAFDSFDITFGGLDFGFNNPSAAVFVGVKDLVFYVHELVYQSQLTNREFGNAIKSKLSELGIERLRFKADAAEPARIEELSQMGLYVEKAKKGADSVKAGIDFVKSYDMFISAESRNVQKDFKNYKNKIDPKTNQILDEPIKMFDHACDAVRYSVFGEELGGRTWQIY